jgi:hypothetical protein
MYDPVTRTYNGIPEDVIAGRARVAQNVNALIREQIRRQSMLRAMDKRVDEALGSCDNCETPMPGQDHVCQERYYDPMSKMPGWEMLGMYPNHRTGGSQ